MEGVEAPIYLDHHSTTPLDGRVLDAMMPYLTSQFGNSSSLDHSYGHNASVAVKRARKQIADAIGARDDEILFTSGATESDNMALCGIMSRYEGDELITCATEHKAILETARHLEGMGCKVTYLPVNELGEIDIDILADSITDRTVMISVMAANNEVGTLHDIGRIGRLAHKRGVLFHTDAAQAAGHIPIDVEEMKIDLMSISSHKLYGPKGVGALYVRSMNPRVRLDPMIYGGGQEHNMRSGTLNVPGVVGFGKAITLATNEMDTESDRFRNWSKRMMAKFEQVGGILNGHPTNRLSANLSVTFPGVEGKAIINSVSKRVAISAGSACTTATVEPSHVLLALGCDEEAAHSTIRVGLGRFNTESEVDLAADLITDACRHLLKIGRTIPA